MKLFGAWVGTMVALVAAAAGCQTRGTLTGAGGGGELSGFGGQQAGGQGGSSFILGGGGAGPMTGTAGYPVTNCGAVTLPAGPGPSNIAIVLDTSASMNDAADGSCTGSCGVASKWTAAVSGIDAVVASTGPSVNWGLEFLGGVGDSCYIGGPAVAVAPKTGGAVITALAGRSAGGAIADPGHTPTRAAVTVTADHLLTLTVPGTPAIILLTDGQPDCDQGAPDGLDLTGTVEAIVSTRIRGVPTFVLGVGALDGETDYALSTMALQGGGARSGPPPYFPVGDASDVVAVMNDIVEAVGACSFAIPPPPTNDGTTTRESISVRADGNATIPYDAMNGWTYSDITHTTLTLRGASCEAVRAGAIREISVVFLCLIG